MLCSFCLANVKKLESNQAATIQMLAALNVVNTDSAQIRKYVKELACQLHAYHGAARTAIAVKNAVKITSAWIQRIALNSHLLGLSGYSASLVVSL